MLEQEFHSTRSIRTEVRKNSSRRRVPVELMKEGRRKLN